MFGWFVGSMVVEMVVWLVCSPVGGFGVWLVGSVFFRLLVCSYFSKIIPGSVTSRNCGASSVGCWLVG